MKINVLVKCEEISREYRVEQTGQDVEIENLKSIESEDRSQRVNSIFFFGFGRGYFF